MNRATKNNNMSTTLLNKCGQLLRRNFFKFFMATIALFIGGQSWGQSVSGLSGGLESVDSVSKLFSAVAPTADNGKWTTAGTSSIQSAIAKDSTTVRSGNYSLKISGTSTSLARIWTPFYTISSTTSKFFIQYYRRSASATNSQTQQLGIIRGGTEQLNGSYAVVTTANTWEKVTYAPTAVTSVTSVVGVIGNKAVGTGGDYFVDDFCMYAGTIADILAPDAPTSPSVAQNGTTPSTKLDVSWTAPGTGID
ncbi:MAG: hypothetical protein WCH52_11025, partial [Bacteroidota bacterium]